MLLRDMLSMAKPCALLWGFRGMLLRENFLKRCNLVRFGVYFDQILSLFLFQKLLFFYKESIFKIHACYGVFLIKKFLKTYCFGVYFETKMAIFIKKYL